MENKKPERNHDQCIESCNKQFIDCVESLRQDCLDRFGSCSSACKV